MDPDLGRKSVNSGIMPTIYLVFMNKLAIGLCPQAFGTLEDAWNGARKQTQEYHDAGGRNLRMLHATFQEFVSSDRPSGSEPPNMLIRDWIWGDYGLGESDTKRVLGECTIKEMTFY